MPTTWSEIWKRRKQRSVHDVSVLTPHPPSLSMSNLCLIPSPEHFSLPHIVHPRGPQDGSFHQASHLRQRLPQMGPRHQGPWGLGVYFRPCWGPLQGRSGAEGEALTSAPHPTMGRTRGNRRAEMEAEVRATGLCFRQHPSQVSKRVSRHINAHVII